MFSIKSKLSLELQQAIKNNCYKNYRVIIHLKSLLEKTEAKIKSLKGEIVHPIPSINCICALLTPRAIERLIELPQVQYIDLDVFALLCGNSVLSSNRVTFHEKYKLTGKGIGIGLIDTGVFPHSDLLTPQNKIKKFLDLVDNLKYPYDDNGHGTFISGVICSSGVSSKGQYRGIAEGSHIYAVKAFNSLGKGYISSILYGIHTILEGATENNIKVICLPFEIVEHNFFILSLFSKLFDMAIEKGISVVVPSGHNGNAEGSIKGIATLNNCITIGGADTTTPIIKPYKYSSSGPFMKLEKPDLIASCVNIYSLNTVREYISERNGMKIYPRQPENLYTEYSGTSIAAAFIAGVCALLYENNPSLSFKDVISLIKVSCNPTNMSKWVQGAGILDLDKLMP